MPIAPAGAAACATVAFRAGGRLCVVPIVKATFAFDPDRPMRRVEPDPIAPAERHHGDDPSRSLAVASDTAPFLARADVLLGGTACGQKARPSSAVLVRLAVLRDGWPLLDKRLLVQTGKTAASPSAPLRVPLLYELAAGGPRADENPVGILAAGGPSIVDPERPGQAAGFGPVASRWPAIEQAFPEVFLCDEAAFLAVVSYAARLHAAMGAVAQVVVD
jgi:hypothetical protein